MLFEESTDASWKMVVDYYWVIVTVFAIMMASWMGFVAFVLGIMWIVRVVLKEKQNEEEILIDKLGKKKQ